MVRLFFAFKMTKVLFTQLIERSARGQRYEFLYVLHLNVRTIPY